MVSNIEHGVVHILTSNASGSGFIIDEDGLVVTNAHVLGSSKSVTVRLVSGKEYIGDVASLGKDADLAIIDLSTSDRFVPITFGDSDLVSVGDNVIAVGYPIGNVLRGSQTVTRGIVSSKRVLDGVDYLQTDAAINPGNSGGPLFDRSGHVVGVNTSKIVKVDIEGVGLAIAINEVKAMLPLLPLAANQDVPLLSSTPTPAAAQVSQLGETYENHEYGYNIEVAPGWTLDEEYETDTHASFWAPERRAFLKITTHNLGGFTTLRQFAEKRWKSILNNEEQHLTAFHSDEKRVGESYWLTYNQQSSAEDCVEYVVERITLHSLYPDKPYGFIVSSRVCEHNLSAYDQVRYDMLNSLTEYSYSIYIAPRWTLDEEHETDPYASSWMPNPRGAVYTRFLTREAYASFWVPNRRGLLEITTHHLGDFPTFSAFAEWRRASVRETGKQWPVFEVISSEKRREGDREFYWFDYRRQESPEFCVSRNVELISRSSKDTEVPYGFIVHSAVCEYSYDIYGQDMIDMLESFKY